MWNTIVITQASTKRKLIDQFLLNSYIHSNPLKGLIKCPLVRWARRFLARHIYMCIEDIHSVQRE